MSRHRFAKQEAAAGQMEFEDDDYGEEYEPTEEEIEQVRSRIGELRNILTERDIVDALCNSSTVQEAIEWIVEHPEYYIEKKEKSAKKPAASPAAGGGGGGKGAAAPATSAPKQQQQQPQAPKPKPSTASPAKAAAPAASKKSGGAKTGGGGAGGGAGGGGGKDHMGMWGVDAEIDALNLSRGVSSTTTASSEMNSEERDGFLDADDEEDEHAGKDVINIVFIGHVDAGKSTLNGQLQHLTGRLSERTMRRHKKTAQELGKGSFAYAFVMDANDEERERGVTMDIGVCHLYTPTKRVVVLDAPGHKDFVPNMLSGASQADAAVLVVDATTGEFESGFNSNGQTREHALLTRSLGVSQLIVAVNKMDMAGWKEERFTFIRDSVGPFLKQAGFPDTVVYIPCSGFQGENLVERHEPKLSSWYSGPTLVQAIDALSPPSRPTELPLRLCVADTFKVGGGVAVAGRLEAGELRGEQVVLIVPGNTEAIVKSIEREGRKRDTAFAGETVTVVLAGIDLTAVGVGYVVCERERPAQLCMECNVQVLTFDISIPIVPGSQCVLYTQSAHETATVTKLLGAIDRATGKLTQRDPRFLGKNMAGVIRIKLERPLCLELFKDFKSLGRVTLRAAGVTLAAGTVIRRLPLLTRTPSA